MAQTDLGKVRLTDAELTDKIIQVNGGVKLGKDADGTPGYVVTDAETGADTVIPFNSGGSSGGFPVNGFICFAGTQVHSIGNPSSQYFSVFFEEPINVSEISEIKTITNINSWYRNYSSYSVNLTRQMYIILYVKNSEGVVSALYPITILSDNTTSGVVITNKEDIIPLSSISSYEKLAGIGCRFYQYPGGSSFSYHFESQIGNVNDPESAKMEYVIS